MIALGPAFANDLTNAWKCQSNLTSNLVTFEKWVSSEAERRLQFVQDPDLAP